MRRQFLGDKPDAFKWSYHDHLMKALGHSELQIVQMLNPDIKNGHGNEDATSFPTDPLFYDLCSKLKASRSFDPLYDLPKLTGGDYRVLFHRKDELFADIPRGSYFSGITGQSDQVVFIDPDNGFVPTWADETHVTYDDVEFVLNQLSESSVVSVYQHHRQGRTWVDIAADIRARIPVSQCGIIYGYKVMFVTISRSSTSIDKVIEANARFAATRELTAAP